jgi:Sulfotransferase family
MKRTRHPTTSTNSSVARPNCCRASVTLITTSVAFGIVLLHTSFCWSHFHTQIYQPDDMNHGMPTRRATSEEEKAEHLKTKEQNNNGSVDSIPFPSSVLPSKVFTVIGLESSGTTLLATTLCHALGLPIVVGNINLYESMGDGFSSHYHTMDLDNAQQQHWTEVQHVSLPWGGENCLDNPTNNVVPVLFPAICTRMMRDRMKVQRPGAHANDPFANNSFSVKNAVQHYNIPMELWDDIREQCNAIISREQWTYPSRYFLNISSHLEWYQSRGVDAHVIIIMRDATISRRARMQHCSNLTLLQLEEKMGRDIMHQAFTKYIKNQQHQSTNEVKHQPPTLGMLPSSPDGKVILVSYELLVQLKQDYMQLIYDQLGINSTFKVTLGDGNRKHVRAMKESVRLPIAPLQGRSKYVTSTSIIKYKENYSPP